jgi:glycosyltransferase involved in cell wall biosynthesis
MREELLAHGIPAERILVNPNAVDPDHFRPGCGGDRVRHELAIARDEIVIGFVGTFGPWHGTVVLQEAIRCLLQIPGELLLRFLLVGEGPLLQEMRNSLRPYETSKQVIFPGIVPHDCVRSYLDAADILVSPHVPMPDGRPFFGSPTKLFEYMALEKGIVASNLDQLAQVLCHNETALLVEPGNVPELTAAILRLAQDPALRNRLGRQARRVAVERHTWHQNAARMLNAERHRSQPDFNPPSSSLAGEQAWTLGSDKP